MDKCLFSIRFTHSEESFKALAHMQYDLFCRKIQFLRVVVSITTIFIGIIYAGAWWAYLLIGYGTFTMLGKYNRANHTAHKLVESLEKEKLPFPSSDYYFTDEKMRVVSAIDGEELSPLFYKDILTIAEDKDNYYLFKNASGGYIIPKKSLEDRKEEFSSFIQSKTGKFFITKRTSALRILLYEYNKRKNEPYHL